MATDYKKWDRIARDIVVSDSEEECDECNNRLAGFCVSDEVKEERSDRSTEKTKKKRRRRKGKKENVME